MPASPEIERKAREIYERVRCVGTIEPGQPWEPIAEVLAAMQSQIDSFQSENAELAREVSDLESELEKTSA